MDDKYELCKQIATSIEEAMKPVIERMVADFRDTLQKKLDLEILKAIQNI